MDEIDKCPMSGCGGRLVVRINTDTEEEFLGCSNYPKCHYTEEIDVDGDFEEDDEDGWGSGYTSPLY